MFIKEGKERYGKGCRGRGAITAGEREREKERRGNKEMDKHRWRCEGRGTKRGTNRDNDVKGGEQREGKTEKTDSCL